MKSLPPNGSRVEACGFGSRQGYSADYDTWVDASDILDPELILEFEEGERQRVGQAGGVRGEKAGDERERGVRERGSRPLFSALGQLFDRCGTFGCTLPDKHPGLHKIPEMGKRSRRADPRAAGSSHSFGQLPGSRLALSTRGAAPSPPIESRAKPAAALKGGAGCEVSVSSSRCSRSSEDEDEDEGGGEGEDEVPLGPRHQVDVPQYAEARDESDRPSPAFVRRNLIDQELAASTAYALQAASGRFPGEPPSLSIASARLAT